VEVSPQGEVRALVMVEAPGVAGRDAPGQADRVLPANRRHQRFDQCRFHPGRRDQAPRSGRLGAGRACCGLSARRDRCVFGSIATLFKMFFRRHKSYPGLAELLQGFYASINGEGQVPVSPESIIQTVRLCEQVGARLLEAEKETEVAAAQALRGGSRAPAAGTGPQGNPGHRRHWLSRQGSRGRAPQARLAGAGPRPAHAGRRAAGAGRGVCRGRPGRTACRRARSPDVEAVVHLAAETAGGKEAHERNTIEATRNVLDTAGRLGIKKVINISSIAVLKPSSEVGHPLSESDPVDFGNLGRGPYVWAKAEAERIAQELGASHGFEVRTLRLGPLVDYRRFSPPGRLGREVGPLFIAIGGPRSELSVCDLTTAAHVVRYIVAAFEKAPHTLNLVEAPGPNGATWSKG
jgi:hypothetical protein